MSGYHCTLYLTKLGRYIGYLLAIIGNGIALILEQEEKSCEHHIEVLTKHSSSYGLFVAFIVVLGIIFIAKSLSIFPGLRTCWGAVEDVFKLVLIILLLTSAGIISNEVGPTIHTDLYVAGMAITLLIFIGKKIWWFKKGKDQHNKCNKCNKDYICNECDKCKECNEFNE